MSITIQNLRIIPYGQKDTLKPVFGDTMHLTFRLADAPQDGDAYTLALDYERILLPTMRPLCAMATEYAAAGTDISFDLDINTERFALWVSALKKPTPVWLQLQRERGGVYTTLLLDDVLALPSVVDGANMVFPGTPLEDKLDKKLDKPTEAGQTGNVLKLGEDGNPVWGEGGGGDVTWDDIKDKPDFAKVATSGSYEDLNNKPSIPDPADFVGADEKGAAGGVATLDSGGAVPDAELPKGEPITTIPAATSAYTLADGCYQHAPTAAPTYTLPTPADATRTHWVVLDVSFVTVQTIAFEDAGGATIVPLDTLTIAANDVVEYLCQYDPLQSKWVIACGKLNS